MKEEWSIVTVPMLESYTMRMNKVLSELTCLHNSHVAEIRHHLAGTQQLYENLSRALTATQEELSFLRSQYDQLLQKNL